MVDYILDPVASLVRVPRPEDFGEDFLASLLVPDGALDHQGPAFSLQVKSNVSDLEEPFGKPVDGKSRQREVLWLLGRSPFSVRPTAFFLAHGDKRTDRVDIYSTVNMWTVRWRGNPAEVQFRLKPWPDAKEGCSLGVGFERLYNEEKPSAGYGHFGPDEHGSAWPARAVVFTGPPVVSFSRDDAKKPVTELGWFFETMRAWTEVDQRNRLAAFMDIPVSWSVYAWETNSPPPAAMIRPTWFANPDPTRGTPGSRIASNLEPFLNALLFVCQQQGDYELYNLLYPVSSTLMGRRIAERFGAGDLPPADMLLRDQLRSSWNFNR